jgi:hypothetical protein
MGSTTLERVSAYQAMSKQESAIIVSALPWGKGWAVQVTVPKKASASDRSKVLGWMSLYRDQLKQQYPMWDVCFRTGENIYLLTIKPANCEDDMRKCAREKETELLRLIMNSYVGR